MLVTPKVEVAIAPVRIGGRDAFSQRYTDKVAVAVFRITSGRGAIADRLAKEGLQRGIVIKLV